MTANKTPPNSVLMCRSLSPPESLAWLSIAARVRLGHSPREKPGGFLGDHRADPPISTRLPMLQAEMDRAVRLLDFRQRDTVSPCRVAAKSLASPRWPRGCTAELPAGPESARRGVVTRLDTSLRHDNDASLTGAWSIPKSHEAPPALGVGALAGRGPAPGSKRRLVEGVGAVRTRPRGIFRRPAVSRARESRPPPPLRFPGIGTVFDAVANQGAWSGLPSSLPGDCHDLILRAGGSLANAPGKFPLNASRRTVVPDDDLPWCVTLLETVKPSRVICHFPFSLPAPSAALRDPRSRAHARSFPQAWSTPPLRMASIPHSPLPPRSRTVPSLRQRPRSLQATQRLCGGPCEAARSDQGKDEEPSDRRPSLAQWPCVSAPRPLRPVMPPRQASRDRSPAPCSFTASSVARMRSDRRLDTGGRPSRPLMPET